MIRLEVNNGYMVKDYEYEDGMTAGSLVQKFKDEEGFRFSGEPVLFDTSQNLQLPTDAELMDGRYYSLVCWIIEKVDEEGNRIGQALLP